MWKFLLTHDHDFFDALGNVVPPDASTVAYAASGSAVKCGRFSRNWVRHLFRPHVQCCQVDLLLHMFHKVCLCIGRCIRLPSQPPPAHCAEQYVVHRPVLGHSMGASAFMLCQRADPAGLS
jgi:hypothetical protein